jgi:LysR substrate binding domain
LQNGQIHPTETGIAFISLARLVLEVREEAIEAPIATGDAVQLANEVLHGLVEAAIITPPFVHPDLHIEELGRDRLVVCLRKDHPLAAKPSLQASGRRGLDS